MEYDIMSPEVISAIAAGVVAILGSFFGFTKYVLDKFLKELKPNGGTSLKDQVNRLEQRVDEIYNILAKRK
jgi:hypothetical protein